MGIWLLPIVTFTRMRCVEHVPPKGLQTLGYKSPKMLRFSLLKIAFPDHPGPVSLYPQS